MPRIVYLDTKASAEMDQQKTYEMQLIKTVGISLGQNAVAAKDSLK